MLRIFFGLIGSLALVTPSPSFAFGEVSVGEVELLGTTTELNVVRKGSLVPVQVRSTIRVGDEISTDQNSAISVKLPDDGNFDLVLIGVNSRVRVEKDAESDAIAFHLLSGELRILEGLEKEKTYFVKTDEAKAIVNGPADLAAFRDENGTHFKVSERSVLVGPPAANSSQLVKLKYGEELSFGTKQPFEMTAPKKFSRYNFYVNVAHSKSGPWGPIWEDCDFVPEDDRAVDETSSGTAK